MREIADVIVEGVADPAVGHTGCLATMTNRGSRLASVLCRRALAARTLQMS